MRAHRIHQARKNHLARLHRPRQEARHHGSCPLPVPLLACQARGIQERPLFCLALQESLFIEPIQRGHHRGIGQRTFHLTHDIAHVGTAQLPHSIHYFLFQRPKKRHSRVHRFALLGGASENTIHEVCSDLQVFGDRILPLLHVLAPALFSLGAHLWHRDLLTRHLRRICQT